VRFGPYLTAVVATLIAIWSCGGAPSGYECLQVGPQVGYPMQPRDMVVITGHTAEDPTKIDYSVVGSADNYLGITDPSLYPQTCYTSPPDQPNYHFIGWLDNTWYLDGGPPPNETYCKPFGYPNCYPQPDQSQGEVTVTLHAHQNNIVIIPFSP
jgi:hypothetical protein